MIDRKISVFETVPKLQAACADMIADALKPSAQGEVVTLALSGGSTPRKMHEMLARKERIDWSNVHVFWGDERTVPPDDANSNYRMARETLLDAVGLPDENIHRLKGELDPIEAAAEYENDLRSVFRLLPGSIPRFDVIVLGMGADGHTASLFPGTDALTETDRLVVANHVPQLDTMRLTFTFPVLNAARLVVFLVAGDDKAEAAQQCMFGETAPPAGLVRPADGDLHWLLDKGAAAGISK
jgi:6-phosphogluconolactonase